MNKFEKAEQRRRILNKLLRFAELKNGWDGYSAPKFDEKYIQKAINEMKPILAKFKKVGFEENNIHVVPTASGHIQFEAESDTAYLEIVIEK